MFKIEHDSKIVPYRTCKKNLSFLFKSLFFNSEIKRKKSVIATHVNLINLLE